MSWLLFAFSGPILWAISTHLDKYLVERYFKHSSVAVLLVFTSLIGLLALPIIWVYQPGVTALSLPAILVIVLSGLLYMGAMYFYLRALQSEEASVVAPFFQAAPLFGYVLGYIVLGETLSSTQLLGGMLIIAGTLILSVRSEFRKDRYKGRLIVLMLACAFSLALSSVIFKLFAIRNEYWVTTFWTFFGEAVFGFGLLAVASYRRQFFALLRANTVAVLTINGANELINLGGGLGVRYALVLAPLSLVQAIVSTSSLFVFIFGVALSAFFPAFGRENLLARNLMQKGVSAVLVVCGVILINR
ncbi:MAG: EamA family transporter [Sulfuricaulis sp.]